VYPLFPKQGVPAKRVLVQGVKGSRAPLELLQGMVLHQADGSYTQEADFILRDGAGLGIRPKA
jgi:tRNA1(Val) A37 N6-methylase TrmN6